MAEERDAQRAREAQAAAKAREHEERQREAKLRIAKRAPAGVLSVCSNAAGCARVNLVVLRVFLGVCVKRGEADPNTHPANTRELAGAFRGTLIRGGQALIRHAIKSGVALSRQVSSSSGLRKVEY